MSCAWLEVKLDNEKADEGAKLLLYFYKNFFCELKQKLMRLFTVYCNATMLNSAPPYSKRVLWSIGHNWMISNPVLSRRYRQLDQFLRSYKMKNLSIYERKIVVESLGDSDKENHKPNEPPKSK